MFDDYKIAVLKYYRELKINQLLSLNMDDPGREKLRRECVTVFLKKNSQHDKDFIQSFFDPTGRFNDQIRSIEQFSLDKFRPLVSFLTQKEDEERNLRDEMGIKLISWLLNGPSYEDWRNGTPFPTIKKVKGEKIIVTSTEKKHNPRISITFGITILFLTLFSGGIVYGLLKNNIDKTIRTVKPTEQCMYWAGQHYEPINCDNNDLDKVKVPLNMEQFNHQQRITMPDTLTSNALGKVWYGKINGSIDKTPQFYTDSGTNPLDTTRRLLPVTTYMLNKYVSYERHLLNMWVWIASLFVLFSLLVTLAYQTRPKASRNK